MNGRNSAEGRRVWYNRDGIVGEFSDSVRVGVLLFRYMVRTVKRLKDTGLGSNDSNDVKNEVTCNSLLGQNRMIRKILVSCYVMSCWVKEVSKKIRYLSC